MVVQSNNQPLDNQDFFDDFNWPIFEIGEIVWLEDYAGDDLANNAIAAVLTGKEADTITLTLLYDNKARQLIDARVRNINQMTGENNFWWQGFAKHIGA